MELMKFSYKERTAITVENGKVELWTPAGSYDSFKLFKNNEGAVMLRSDEGWWWDQHKKEAPYCWYAQWWMGEFPYSSWCFALRICKVTGKATITEIETEINPRSATYSERWIAECKSYVPEGHSIQTV